MHMRQWLGTAATAVIYAHMHAYTLRRLLPTPTRRCRIARKRSIYDIDQ